MVTLKLYPWFCSVLRSQVFSNISKILSHSEEEQDDLSLSMHESHVSSYSQVKFYEEN